MEMRALLLACLAVVLCVDVANSLTCYTCSYQNSNDQCLTPALCIENETACLTLVENIDVGTHQEKVISKTCISNCSIFEDFYECCSQDNCNRNKASGMQPLIVVLGTAVLVSVTRPLLWTGH